MPADETPQDEILQPDTGDRDGAVETSRDDVFLAELRAILLVDDRAHVGQVTHDVADLKQLLGDDEKLTQIIAPVMDRALRTSIEQNREEMIEALYPIIGQTVVRAVREAVQDLARTVDARVRTSFSPGLVFERLQARMSGVSSADLALRDALPFRVEQVFLIHRASGLLLRHVSIDPAATQDSDLVSGMLTAVRDFAADAFGRRAGEQLDVIEYGGRRILIEAAEDIYLAVVVDGVEPSGFRAEMRDRVIAIENRYYGLLRNYEGDATPLATVDSELISLSPGDLETVSPPLSRNQRRVLAGLIGVVFLCAIVTCLGGGWLFRALDARWMQEVIVVTATPTLTVPTPSPTATATATATPTSTPTPSPTATPTPTLTPSSTPTPSPTLELAALVSDVRLNVRSGPGLVFPIVTVLPPGSTLRVAARSSDLAWWNVCCLADGSSGWISAAYVLIGSGLLPPETPAP